MVFSQSTTQSDTRLTRSRGLVTRSYVLAVHLWTRQAQRSSQREVLTGPRRSSRTRRGPHHRDLARRHIKQDKALANPLFGLLGACGAILDVATQGRFSLEGFHYCVLLCEDLSSGSGAPLPTLSRSLFLNVRTCRGRHPLLASFCLPPSPSRPAPSISRSL